MSDTSQTDEYSDDDQAEDQGSRAFVRKLEKRAKEAEARAQELESKLTTFERQSIFRDAGLDPSNKQHALLMKSYDGELSTDAVRAEAEEYGFVSPKESPVSQDELSKVSRMDRASVDAPPVPPVGTTEELATKLLGTSDRNEFWSAVRANDMVTRG